MIILNCLQVEKGTRILTDGWQSYKTLPEEGFLWDFVNHSENFVKPGDRSVHTNRIEGARLLYQLNSVKNDVQVNGIVSNAHCRNVADIIWKVICLCICGRRNVTSTRKTISGSLLEFSTNTSTHFAPLLLALKMWGIMLKSFLF